MPADEEDERYFQGKEFRDALARYENALRQGQSVYMEADELTDIAEYYMTRERDRKSVV